MMNLQKRVLALCLAGALSLGLAACSSAPKEKTAQDVLDQAVAQEKDAVSMSATMVMEMDMKTSANGQEQTVEMLTTMDMSTILDPLKLKMTMNMEAAGQSMDMAVYAQEEDGEYKLYMNDGTSWYSDTVDLSALEEYMASSDLEMIMDSGAGLKEEGSEELNGVDTFKYSGAFSGEDASDIITGTGALDSLSSLGVDPSQIMSDLGEDLSDIPVTVWIDKESCRVVRYEMDMADNMNDIVTQMLISLGSQVEGLTMEIPKMKISMDCYDYGAVEDFEIPAEALAS